jgi:hypothetical protein
METGIHSIEHIAELGDEVIVANVRALRVILHMTGLIRKILQPLHIVAKTSPSKIRSRDLRPVFSCDPANRVGRQPEIKEGDRPPSSGFLD